jgi:hypothetical protein
MKYITPGANETELEKEMRDLPGDVSELPIEKV